MSTADGHPGEVQLTLQEWQRFIDALQALVLVAGHMAEHSPPRDLSSASRELVAATVRVLDLAREVVSTTRAVSPSVPAAGTDVRHRIN